MEGLNTFHRTDFFIILGLWSYIWHSLHRLKLFFLLRSEPYQVITIKPLEVGGKYGYRGGYRGDGVHSGYIEALWERPSMGSLNEGTQWGTSMRKGCCQKMAMDGL